MNRLDPLYNMMSNVKGSNEWVRSVDPDQMVPLGVVKSHYVMMSITLHTFIMTKY